MKVRAHSGGSSRGIALAMCLSVTFLVDAQSPSHKEKSEVHVNKHLAALAKKGDVDSILQLANSNTEVEHDRLTYKWLLLAKDFGHANADDAMSEFLEFSTLRYDDEQIEKATAQCELGLDYLAGRAGVPHSKDLAVRHLRESLPLLVAGVDLKSGDGGTSDSSQWLRSLLRLYPELAHGISEAALADVLAELQ